MNELEVSHPKQRLQFMKEQEFTEHKNQQKVNEVTEQLDQNKIPQLK